MSQSLWSASGKKASNAKRDDGDPNRVIVGNSDNGGAANANWNHPSNSNDNVGFRVAVVLSQPKYKTCPKETLRAIGRCFDPTTKHLTYLL